MRTTRSVQRALAGAFFASLLAACAPEIGDDCTTSSDCVTTDANRLCLTQVLEGFPGGYCTVFNCEPGSCPSEAVCVGYRTELANSEQCESTQGRARLQRSYCMRTCGSDGDCRSGYACVDVGGDDPWGAEVLERGSRADRTKICTLAYSEPEEEPDRSSDVCSWSLPTPLPDAGIIEPVNRRDAGEVDASSPADAGPVVEAGLRNPFGDADLASSEAGAVSSEAGVLPSEAGVLSSEAGTQPSAGGAVPSEAGAAQATPSAEPSEAGVAGQGADASAEAGL